MMSLTRMAASMTAFSRNSKPNNFLISQSIFIIFFFHQTGQLNRLFIFQHVYYLMCFPLRENIFFKLFIKKLFSDSL